MAAMVSISLFVPEVKPHLIMCVGAIAIIHIRHAAIEFCEKSRYWREDLAPINAVANTASYTLVPPVDALIWDVVNVRHNNKDLAPALITDLDAISNDWRAKTSGDARSWIADERDNIRLVPIPSASGTGNITVRIVAKPSRTATTLPKQLYDNYLHEIAAGAKSRLMAIVDQPWSNPAMVEYYNNIFMAGVKKASIDVARGYNMTALRTRPISTRF